MGLDSTIIESPWWEWVKAYLYCLLGWALRLGQGLVHSFAGKEKKLFIHLCFLMPRPNSMKGLVAGGWGGRWWMMKVVVVRGGGKPSFMMWLGHLGTHRPAINKSLVCPKFHSPATSGPKALLTGTSFIMSMYWMTQQRPWKWDLEDETLQYCLRSLPGSLVCPGRQFLLSRAERARCGRETWVLNPKAQNFGNNQHVRIFWITNKCTTEIAFVYQFWWTESLVSKVVMYMLVVYFFNL